MPRKGLFAGLVLKNELIATLGEFMGTTLFLWLAEGTAKTAIASQTASQLQTETTLSNITILIISTGFGLSLLTSAWVFYRITGGLFNPAVTLALWLCGAVHTVRAVFLVIAQILGGIAAAGLVAAMTPGGVSAAAVALQPGVSIAQGLFLEALGTAALVFTVLMLAAEKHRATYLAPIGIGLVLFVIQLWLTLWTGCGVNPARAFGPAVIQPKFHGYHWLYWVGPFIGSLIAVFIYITLKALDYGSVVLGQDSDSVAAAPVPIHTRLFASASHGFSRSQREALKATGLAPAQVDDIERQMVQADAALHPALNLEQENSRDTAVEPIGMMNAKAQNDGGLGRPGGFSRGPTFLGADNEKTAPIGQTTSEAEQAAYVADSVESRAAPMAAQAQDVGGISQPGSHPGLFSAVLRD